MSTALYLTDAAGNLWAFTTDVNGVWQSSLASTGIPSVQPPPPVGQVPVSKLIKRVQVLLDDQNGQRFDSEYVSNFIPQVNEDLIIEFASEGVEYGEQVVELPGFAQDSHNLIAYQGPGSILEFMILPISIEYKTPGAPVIEYVPVPKVDKVLDTQGVNGIASWELRSSIVHLSPSTAPVDLRVRFFGVPMMGDPPDPQADAVVRATLATLVYRLAGEIAGTNESPVSEQRFALKANNSMENLTTLITKQDQAGIRRFGRYNRRYPGSSMWGVPTVTT